VNRNIKKIFFINQMQNFVNSIAGSFDWALRSPP
jgi:hypothetical protein